MQEHQDPASNGRVFQFPRRRVKPLRRPVLRSRRELAESGRAGLYRGPSHPEAGLIFTRFSSANCVECGLHRPVMGQHQRLEHQQIRNPQVVK